MIYPKRTWAFGSLHGSIKEMRKYRPNPKGRSAKFLKVCEMLNGAPRCFFYDSACVSNLAQNKANLIAYNKKTKKYHLTQTGKDYLRKHPEIKVNLDKWMLEDSKYRSSNGLCKRCGEYIAQEPKLRAFALVYAVHGGNK